MTQNPGKFPKTRAVTNDDWKKLCTVLSLQMPNTDATIEPRSEGVLDKYYYHNKSRH
jgi:hypothetical protein